MKPEKIEGFPLLEDVETYGREEGQCHDDHNNHTEAQPMNIQRRSNAYLVLAIRILNRCLIFVSVVALTCLLVLFITIMLGPFAREKSSSYITLLQSAIPVFIPRLIIPR